MIAKPGKFVLSWHIRGKSPGKSATGSHIKFCDTDHLKTTLASLEALNFYQIKRKFQTHHEFYSIHQKSKNISQRQRRVKRGSLLPASLDSLAVWAVQENRLQLTLQMFCSLLKCVWPETCKQPPNGFIFNFVCILRNTSRLDLTADFNMLSKQIPDKGK